MPPASFPLARSPVLFLATSLQSFAFDVAPTVHPTSFAHHGSKAQGPPWPVRFPCLPPTWFPHLLLDPRTPRFPSLFHGFLSPRNHRETCSCRHSPLIPQPIARPPNRQSPPFLNPSHTPPPHSSSPRPLPHPARWADMSFVALRSLNHPLNPIANSLVSPPRHRSSFLRHPNPPLHCP